MLRHWSAAGLPPAVLSRSALAVPSRSSGRRALAAAVDHITITPAGGKHWNPDRITITWRT
jgi:hypothetical protein